MTVEDRRLQAMREFIERNSDGFGRVVIVESHHDQYSVGFEDGHFVYVNFSPREYSEYSRRVISPEDAWGYLASVGLTDASAGEPGSADAPP